MTAPRYGLELQFLGAGPDDGPTLSNPLDNRFITDDEYRILKKLQSQLLSHLKGNATKQSYYEARQVVQHLDISVPAHLAGIGTAVGWAGTTVDAIDERIDFLGWVNDSGDLNGLDEAYLDNDLDVESNYAHIDSLTTGVSFISVGNDRLDLLGNELAEGDERQLITVESSSTATVLWDYRKRRSIAGLSQTCDDNGNIVMETLYLEMANIVFSRDNESQTMEIVDRNQHNLGRCFMTRLCNRARPHQLEGRSEISPAVRYYTDAAVRTMLGMEVNREFYVAPQRFVLNAKPEDFGVTSDMSAEEKYRRGLSVAMGMINIVPPREDNTEGDPPAVVEFKPAPPTPFIEQVKAYSIQMSAETGLPATLFGFVTDNPTSGDAIVKSEFRLTRRSARRISSFGLGWKEVALLTLLARDGDVETDFIRNLRCRYANPMLPTPAATADELQKMVAAKILVPDSSVTYELYGRLDDRQVAQLEQDKKKFEAKQLRAAVEQAEIAAAAAPQPAPGQQGVGGGGKPSTQKKPAAE
jgi:hypothetical protein